MSHTGFGTFSTEEVEIAKGYHYRNDNEQFILTPHFHPNSMVYAGGMYQLQQTLQNLPVHILVTATTICRTGAKG